MAKIKGAGKRTEYNGTVLTLKANKHVSSRNNYRKLFIASVIINIILILTTIVRETKIL